MKDDEKCRFGTCRATRPGERRGRKTAGQTPSTTRPFTLCRRGGGIPFIMRAFALLVQARLKSERQNRSRETHLSTAQQAPQAHARIPQAYVDQERPARPRVAPSQRPQTPHSRLTEPSAMRPYVSLRGRREFATTMRRGAFASAPVLTVHAFAPAAKSAGKPKVGVIVTRKVGKAVVRNRIRRRCKAILETLLRPDDARWFVVTCRPAAAQARFADLHRQLSSALPNAAKSRGARA